MPQLPGKVFARRLREERERAGVTQAALAQRLTDLLDHRIDASAISRIEKCERSVRLDEAVILAETLQVSLSSLLTDRTSVDEKLGELRRDLALFEWQVDQAEEQLERTRRSVVATSRAIAELETSHGE